MTRQRTNHVRRSPLQPVKASVKVEIVSFVGSLITDADDSRVSKAISGVCDPVILSVCLCVCLHDETKTTKLGTEIVHHDT